MNIVEVISNEGVKSTSGEQNIQKRYQTPMPGDPVLFDSNEYPFNSQPYGRIDGKNNFCDEGKISICCGGASVFLGKDGNVSISGGPFESVKISKLEPTFDLMKVSFWNWGDNRSGANMGVYYTIERPVFKLKTRALPETILQKSIKLDKVIEEITEATEENDHNRARSLLAEHLKNVFLINAYLHVTRLQNQFGHIPEHLQEFRRIELDPLLMKEAQKQFPEQISKINNAF